MIRSIITYVVLFISLCPVTYADFLDLSKNPEDTIEEILNETSQPRPFEFPTSIVPIIDNFRGWTKLSLPDSSSPIWMPDIFFTSGFTSETNPNKWMNKIKNSKSLRLCIVIIPKDWIANKKCRILYSLLKKCDAALRWANQCLLVGYVCTGCMIQTVSQYWILDRPTV